MPKRDYYNDPAAPKANSLVPAVAAVIRDEMGRVLMIRRTDNDLYAIPGGAQDLGETVRPPSARPPRKPALTSRSPAWSASTATPAMSSPMTTAKSARSSPSASAPARLAASCAPAARAKKSCGSTLPSSTRSTSTHPSGYASNTASTTATRRTTNSRSRRPVAEPLSVPPPRIAPDAPAE